MKVLIFADSHGYNMAMAFAVDREEPDAVIHLGDHAEDAREIERVFPAMPICRVRGNNDFDPEVPLNAVVTPGGVRIYITHGHRERVGMLSSGIVSQRAYEEHCPPLCGADAALPRSGGAPYTEWAAGRTAP